MINIKTFLIILASVGFAYLLLQLTTIIQNYSEIVRFISIYNKFEYGDLPNDNFIDKTVYDPNDYGIAYYNKWRCVFISKGNDSGFYQISRNGVIVNLFEEYIKFDFEKDCIKNLFTTSNEDRNFTNPCGIDTILCNEILKI